jgi:hypothetical protein
VHFPRITTYDNTATPTGDGDRREVKTAPVDQERLQAIIGEAVEKAKADDPKELRRMLAEKDRELKRLQGLAASGASIQKQEVKAVDRPAITDKQLTEIDTLITRAEAAIQKAAEIVAEPVVSLNGSIADLIAAVKSVRQPQAPAQTRQAPAGRTPPAVAKSGPVRQPDASGDRLPPGEMAILVAAAQCWPSGLTRSQASILTGYKKSSRDAYIQRLVGRGMVEVVGGDVFVTAGGTAALGDGFKPLPTGSELRQYWLDRLPPGEAAILRFAVDAYPHSASVEDIDSYKKSSRDAYIQRLVARHLVTRGRGTVQASDHLFDRGVGLNA